MPINRRRAVRVVRRRRYNVARRGRVRVLRRGVALTKVIGSNIHHFKRTAYYSGFLAGSTVMDVVGAMQFQLNALPNYTEFTNLFDCYRINAIKVTLMPRANSAEAGTNQGLVKLFTVIDTDDATSPTNLQEVLQYENVKSSNSAYDHKRYLKPKIARSLYQAGGIAAYGESTGWIDCSNPGVPHYGLKYVLQQLPAGAQSWDCKIKYYLSFKNVV